MCLDEGVGRADWKRCEQESTRELSKQQNAKCCARGTQTAVSDGSQQQMSDGETRRQGRLKKCEREQRAEAEVIKGKRDGSEEGRA